MPHEWEKINKYCVKIEVSQYDMKSFKLLFTIML
jgi:hypothetical protein